jgi:Fe2+ or Zn2+ uptake regulation protein
VYEALAELGGHRGVDEVSDWLQANGYRLPPASVYNALDTLVAAGLAVVAHRGPPRALYEVAGGAHDHFECRACGALLDVPTTRRRPVTSPIEGAVVDEVQLTYRGVCADCKAD